MMPWSLHARRIHVRVIGGVHATAKPPSLREAHTSEFAISPPFVRPGQSNTPNMDHVRHRLSPNSSTFDVDITEKNGKIFESGGETVVQRSGAIAPAGVSTYNGTLPAFMLASALKAPKQIALWTLPADTPFSNSLAVRFDPTHSQHVLWAPSRRMELIEFEAALASVGCDQDG